VTREMSIYQIRHFPQLSETVDSLFLSKSKHNTRRITDIVLVVTEVLGGPTQIGAVELSHDIPHLNRLDGDAIGQLVVQTAAGRGREGLKSEEFTCSQGSLCPSHTSACRSPLH
jgi:hypothetical protein